MSARLPIIEPARNKTIPEAQFPSPNLRDRSPTSTSRHEKHASPSRSQWYVTTACEHKENLPRMTWLSFHPRKAQPTIADNPETEHGPSNDKKLWKEPFDGPCNPTKPRSQHVAKKEEGSLTTKPIAEIPLVRHLHR